LRRKKEAVAQLLVDRGANLSATARITVTNYWSDDDPESGGWVGALLALALKRGYDAVVRLMIVRGAVSAANKNGNTPLHSASMQGDEAMARLLLDQGANVSAADYAGQTPLLFALRHQNEAVARLLVDRGADLSATARVTGPNYWSDDEPEFGGWVGALLALASMRGYDAVVRLMIDRGADISAANENGMTPLHAASMVGDEAMARLLLDRGADVSAANENGMTPLHVASQKGHGAVVRLLVDSGGNVSCINKDGDTPLHAASKNGHEAVVRLLVDRGANVSAGQPKRVDAVAHRLAERPSGGCSTVGR
jgi:ankyrin repeat protein